MDAKTLHPVVFILVLVGALNWGLIGLFNLNVVNALLGSMPIVEKVVYILVGAAAVWLVLRHKDECKWCGKK